MKTVSIVIADIAVKLAPTPLAVLVGTSRELGVRPGTQTAEQVNALIACVFASARRAKCEVTEDWLRENIDLTNGSEVFRAWAEVNGLELKTADEAGEAGAVGAT